MSNDLSRVYQFLSTQGDWVKKADVNGDNFIVKDEFRLFMEENFFSWNGEQMSSTAQDDLINKFWNEFDTNKSKSMISGADLHNKHTLDSNEIDVLEDKLEMYKTLNSFINELECPVSSSKGWKEEINSELLTLLESYIENGGTNESLLEYLQENATGIVNRISAQYIAAEYLDKVMPELSQKYDYAFGSDKDLNELIDSYVDSLDENASLDDIQKNLADIIDSYIATSGLQASNGTTPPSSSTDSTTNNTTVQTPGAGLNQLQLSVAETTLKENLAAIKNEANYEEYAEVYDKAVSSYIDEILKNATQEQYNTILGYGIEDFKQTSYYKNIARSIEVRDVMIFADNTSELYKAIESELGTDVAEALTNGIYYDSYSSIIDDAVEKINEGMFIKNDSLDKNALIEWVVDEIRANYTDILTESGAIDDLSTDELYQFFTKSLSNANAIKKSNPEKALDMVKDAAITYCESVSAKGEAYEEYLADIFESSNFSSVINDCKTPDAVAKYVEKVNAGIGDVKEKEPEKEETVEEKVTVTDESDAIISEINNSVTYKGVNASQARSSLAYRLNKDGYVLFVGDNYSENKGIWDDPVDQELNDLFNIQLRSKIEEQYKDEISGLGLTSNELDNLFNIALFTTLSDTTVLRSMYDEINIGTVLEATVKNYSKILIQVSTNENARNYIKNVENKSLLNGVGTWAGADVNGKGDETTADYRTYFKTLDKYYSNDSTAGGDDWVSIASRGETSYSCNGGAGNIIILTSADSGDNDPVNKAMQAMLTDYVSSYSDTIDASRIIALFKEAQQTAFAKLEAVKDQSSANGASIYGYGDYIEGATDNSDTYRVDGDYYGVNSILINIMYEMERLLSKEVLG